jgi:hypothetical protein
MSPAMNYGRFVLCMEAQLPRIRGGQTSRVGAKRNEKNSPAFDQRKKDDMSVANRAMGRA